MEMQSAAAVVVMLYRWRITVFSKDGMPSLHLLLKKKKAKKKASIHLCNPDLLGTINQFGYPNLRWTETADETASELCLYSAGVQILQHCANNHPGLESGRASCPMCCSQKETSLDTS